MDLKKIKRPPSQAKNVSEALKKIGKKKDDVKEGVDLTKMAKNLFKRKISQEGGE